MPDLSITPAASFGPPVRSGNRVYLLTGQWRSNWGGSSRRASNSTSDLLVDFWSFDASTLQPVYRKRIQKVRDGAMYGRSILGIQNQTAWLLLPSGLHATNIQTGALRATPKDIEDKNPQLRGLLPTEGRYYSFTKKAGMTVVAADASTWFIHPDTLQAAKQPHQIENIPPPHYTPMATYAFQERGYVLGSHWLGMLTATEAATFNRPRGIAGLDHQTPRALYAADVTKAETFFGAEDRVGNLKALTQPFLASGLLSLPLGSGPNALVYRRDPDSVFILHKSRIDEEAVIQLARVTGPEGKVMWNVALPLSVLQSVLPGEESLVFYGRLFTKADPNDRMRRDPMHTAREMLITIDWKTGAHQQHDQSDTKRHPDATN